MDKTDEPKPESGFSLSGYLLIATPALQDPNFSRAGILLIQHDQEGAMGVILNRPLNKTIGEAWQQVSDTALTNAQPLHEGGPCPGPLLALHKMKPHTDLEVTTGIYAAISSESVTALAEGNAEPVKFIFGNAGWSPGQLEAEIREGSWLLIPARPDTVFGPTEGLWLHLAREASRRAAAPFIPAHIVPTDPHMN